MRIDVLRQLASRRIPSYAFVGPLMTHFVDAPKTMDRLMADLARAEVKFIYAELLYVAPPLLQRLQSTISGFDEDVAAFISAQVDPNLLNIGHKRDPVCRAVEDHGCGHARKPECSSVRAGSGSGTALCK